jgi:quercetin dioxygenase-like cupin family protein
VTVEAGRPLDLRSGAGRAVLWGLATEDLNVNLVVWPAGDGVASHTNSEVDVLLVVIDGVLAVDIDGDVRTVRDGQAIVIPRGATRSLTATGGAVRYLSSHRRRAPLGLSPSAAGRSTGSEHPAGPCVGSHW